MAKVKFIRLGYNNAVDVSKYNSYKSAGNIVFARVDTGVGTWYDDTSTYVKPSYYIWANGIEYHVADASALKYAMNVAEQAAADISILNGGEDVEGSVTNSIKIALASIKPEVNIGSELPTTGKHGDYFIKKDTSNGIVYQLTAYIWDASTGESGAWVALNGNVNADNVYFPSGIQRTELWGVKPLTQDIQTECVGNNLRELLEQYLVKESFPEISTVTGTAIATKYAISLNKPNALSTYMSSTTALVYVGTSYTFNGVSLSEVATHNGAASYTGTASSITGMKYGSAATTAGPVDKDAVSKTSSATTATMEYTPNFSTATATLTIDNQSGFTGILDASATITDLSSTQTLSLSSQTGVTTEGTNKLVLSWSNTANVTRTFAASPAIAAIPTVYYASNKGNLDSSHNSSTKQVDWTDAGSTATKVTYSNTNLTVTSVYPIYTNGGRVSDTGAKETSGSFVDPPQKIGIWDYTSANTKTKYIGFGSTSLSAREIYFPKDSSYTFSITSAKGYNPTAKDYSDNQVWFNAGVITTIDDKEYYTWRCNTEGAGANDIEIVIKRA